MPQQTDLNTVTEDLIRAFLQFKKLRREGSRPWADPRRPLRRLKGSEIMLLFVLNEACGRFPEGVPVSELSRALGVRPPSITPLLAGLEERDLLERTMDLNDRRVVRVRLKQKGRELIGEQRHHTVERFRGLVEYLGVEKSVMLTELINEAFAYLKVQHEQAGRGFPHSRGRGVR